MQIAFHSEAQVAFYGGKFIEADVAEFRLKADGESEEGEIIPFRFAFADVPRPARTGQKQLEDDERVRPLPGVPNVLLGIQCWKNLTDFGGEVFV